MHRNVKIAASLSSVVMLITAIVRADGLLTLHSSSDAGAGGSSFNTSGHTWIEYHNFDTGEITTYGTWGNNPNSMGNGLHENIELNGGYDSDASRTTYLTDTQQQGLFNEIDSYRNQGADGWGYLNPCSGFATDAWNAATPNGDHISDGWISTPENVEDSIRNKNGGNDDGATEAAAEWY